MKTLKALKSRREGIEKINKITRAMEAIAATRLHRYEAAILRFRPYVLAQKKMVENLALRLKKVNSLWTELPVSLDSKPRKTSGLLRGKHLTGPEQNKKGIAILISSDHGFCGGFNNQLFQLVEDLEDKQSFSFIAIGRKGARHLKKQHFNLIEESSLPDDAQLSDFVPRIAKEVISSYREQRQKIYLIFNKFRRNLLGRGFLRQLFPLETPGEREIILDYLFEPDIEAVQDEILSLYAHSEIKAAILESKAAEEMARMVAMTQATRSAEDLIKSLTQQYHKARQAGITKELVEIANAIR